MQITLKNFDNFWDYSNPKKTEQLFLELKEKHENVIHSDEYLQLLSQIARACGLQNKFEEGLNYIHAAEQELKDEHIIAKARIILEKSRLLFNYKNDNNVLNMLKENLEYCTQNNLETYAIDTIHMLGIVDSPQNQIMWNLKALKIIESSSNPKVKPWLGPLYNNLGWSYIDNNEFEKALELFQKDFEWRKKINRIEEALIAKWSIGYTLRKLGRLEEALETQLFIKNEREKESLPKGGYNYEELGEIYLLKGKSKEAKECFKIAYNILQQDEWLQTNEKERLDRLKSLSE